ncbi:MAG: IS200/IS605 family transposase [Phycisphaerae bacterium]
MGHSYTNLLYHIVFATKDRRPWLVPPIATRLHAYLGGGIRDEGGTALIVNGTADHVHILARLRQDKALSDVIRSIKANASKWIHQTFAPQRSFAWQAGYGAFTVSESQVEKVRRYIADQEIHHCKRSFDEEFAALLRAHGISLDANRL